MPALGTRKRDKELRLGEKYEIGWKLPTPKLVLFRRLQWALD